jgi:ribosomal protein S18 acetylase RimI-like enzyme
VIVLTVFEVHAIDDEVAAAVAGLVRQLSPSAPALRREDLSRLVDSPAITLFGIRDEGGPIVGILTLALFPTPTGLRAWIEDVVVDEAGRGQGAGETLTRAALEAARTAGARTVDLTSRPSRDAANRLYRRVGFEQRETNVYRYRLQG